MKKWLIILDILWQKKYAFHSKRAFENHLPKGSHMTEKELNAFSMGYVTHARQAAGSFVYKNPDYKPKTKYGKQAASKRG